MNIRTGAWFAEQRLAWIKETLDIFGVVRREHVMKKFRIGTAQASLDLREAQRLWPDLMEYDLSKKIYKVKV